MTLVQLYLDEEILLNDKKKAKWIPYHAPNYYICYRAPSTNDHPPGHSSNALPPEEAKYVMIEFHEGNCGDHHTAQILALKILCQGYYWPKIYKDTTEYVQKCY